MELLKGEDNSLLDKIYSKWKQANKGKAIPVTGRGGP
jgi:hypothetical protein